MNFRLFDEIERTGTGYKLNSETDYAYLNRSARSEAQKIRSLLEGWFSRYPNDPEAQNKFLKRFKGVEHDKAFFELYIHEILLKQGGTCQQVEPEIPGHSTHPEFLMEGRGQVFYIEAIVPDLPQDDAINQRLCDELIDELNKTPSEYYLDVDFEGLLRNRLSLKGLKTTLENGKPGERFELEGDGAKIVITILEYKKETKDEASVLTVGYGAYFGSPGATMLRKAIGKKATRYGELKKPYLIAINVKGSILHDIEVSNALFGDLCVRINPKTGESIPGRDHRTAKLLSPKGDPKNTRVSGIILLDNLVAWNIAQCTPVLWHNPFAEPETSFPSELWQLPQQIPNKPTGILEKMEGKSVSELLGLPQHWPEEGF